MSVFVEGDFEFTYKVIVVSIQKTLPSLFSGSLFLPLSEDVLALVGFLVREPVHLQHIIPLNFSRKVWHIRAYTNGLTVELNSTSICKTVYAEVLTLRDEWLSMPWAILSGNQHIPKMAVIVITIKLTRFRALMMPCE